MSPASADERPHAPTDDPTWVEAYLFDVVHDDGAIGVSVELLLRPQVGRAALHVSIVQPDAPLISLVDAAALAPKPPSLEVRAPGLWTDVGIQTPLEHVTVDIEAFAVSLDDPDEVFAGAYGIRTAVGSELEWETAGEIVAGPAADSYEVPCIVHGELLIDDRTIEIDGWGWRSHRWGPARADDRSGFRGRAADGRWLLGAEPDASISTVIGRAPVPDPFLDRPLRQALVRSTAGDIGWSRRLDR